MELIGLTVRHFRKTQRHRADVPGDGRREHVSPPTLENRLTGSRKESITAQIERDKGVRLSRTSTNLAQTDEHVKADIGSNPKLDFQSYGHQWHI